MLLAEINGEPAVAHPASRVFIQEGFIATAMGLQARLRPIAAAPRTRGGIAIAASVRGGRPMAEPRRNDEELVDNPGAEETRDTEQERVRSSNDRDQEMERSGEVSSHNRGYDDAVRGYGIDREEDVDPDSAESDVDRDDV